MNCKFIAANEVAQPGVDGTHLDEASHYGLAKEIAQLIGQCDGGLGRYNRIYGSKKSPPKVTKAPQDIRAKRYVKSLKSGEYAAKDVPYQCQFASPELAKDILEKRVAAKDDPHWEVFGYTTREESEYWAWRQCGICCAKMALEHYGKKPGTVARLTAKGVELGGYNTKTDEGWFYKPLAALLQSYRLAAEVAPYLSLEQLAKHVADGKLVIASVNPEIIRGDKNVTNTNKVVIQYLLQA